MSDGKENWELAKLIGKYETFTEGVDRRLGKIEGHLEKGSEAFMSINTTIATKTEQINNMEKRMEDLEDNGGLSKRRRWQVDGTTLAAIALALKEIITAILGH